uniref:3-hydroxyacyl-CoA dehydrogenase n=1 Tax=Nakamurella alba TaxID=2665158 RepID=A0A7K1FIC3_9ACTN|nr:3-hydroxyacyl-CoA dehydrogenase NAD-binding domain-containing protein [Nakamurella alba]MTD13875.1 hypothetical protein [Nakamurella alba]
MTVISRTDDGSVAVLTLDVPGRSTNVVDEQVLAELADHHSALEADPAIEAFVVTSGKKSGFGAGADLDWLPQLVARPDAAEYLGGVHALMARIAGSGTPMVAAVDGFAFGGALELLLAGEEIVVTPSATLGLPEVTLGLLPGGAGTQLVRRWLTAEQALDVLLTGRPLTAAAAQEAGLVQEIVAPEDLLAVAIGRARAAAARTTRRTDRDSSESLAAAAASRRETLAPAAGSAPDRILGAVAAGAAGGFAAGSAAEVAAFLDLAVSPTSLALRHLFQAEADIKRRSRSDGAPVSALGVVGAGRMGAAIAATAVTKGLQAVVRDVGQDKVDEAHGYLDQVLSRTKASPDKRAAAEERWSGTTEWEGFAGADAVIEAVFELPSLKNETLSAISGLVAPDALISTNTSAIPISSLAPAVSNPGRFMGTHFFSPVDRMPLVELIPHTGTDPATVARVAGLARSLGKVPVVVADVPGFLTSRVYARWLIEGVRLLLEGVPVPAVDAAAKAGGFPVGPLQAHDEASLDLVVKASITQVAEAVMTDRLDVATVRAALEKLIAAGVTGRKDGSGFYAYADGRRSGANPLVADTLGVTADVDAVPADVVRDRLLYAFASECWVCWDEGIVCHPDDGDVAAVLGIGFPRPLGGPYHWADAVGAATVVARAAELDPVAFPVGARLPAFAADGGSFAAETRLAVPGRPA